MNRSHWAAQRSPVCLTAGRRTCLHCLGRAAAAPAAERGPPAEGPPSEAYHPKWAGDTHTYRTTAAAASDSTVLGGGHAIYRARLRQSTSPTCSSAERTSRPSRPRTRCSSSTSAPPKSPSAARSALPLPRARGEHRGDARQSAAMPSPLIGEPPMHRPVTYCPVRTRRASAGASGRIVKYIADFRRKKRELRVSVWPGWFIPILYLWNSSLYRLF